MGWWGDHVSKHTGRLGRKVEKYGRAVLPSLLTGDVVGAVKGIASERKRQHAEKDIRSRMAQQRATEEKAKQLQLAKNRAMMSERGIGGSTFETTGATNIEDYFKERSLVPQYEEALGDIKKQGQLQPLATLGSALISGDSFRNIGGVGRDIKQFGSQIGRQLGMGKFKEGKRLKPTMTYLQQQEQEEELRNKPWLRKLYKGEI